MRNLLAIALILSTSPVLADLPKPPVDPDAKTNAISAPPSPPPIEWQVNGYVFQNNQWVLQPDHCLKTTDLKKADAYSAEIMKFQNWIACSNLPALCCTLSPDKFSFPCWLPAPESPTNEYTVWAFQLKDGTWVKDEKYCWTTRDYHNCRIDALAYAAKVNAVPGWCATTNAPESVDGPRNDVIMYHGPAGYADGNYTSDSGWNGSFLGYSRGGYPMYSEHGGRTIQRPHMTIRLGRDADWEYSHTPHPINNDP